MNRSIYLDNSATTQVRQEVREAMQPYLDEKWGNPSSVHYYGRQARQAVDEARQSIAALLSCEEDEIYFTPCATYSNNTALLGRARFVLANDRSKRLVTSQIEHPSCIGPARHLESAGWQVEYLSVDREGFFCAQALKKALNNQAGMVSLMWANNEIGCVQDMSALVEAAKESGAFFHTDAVQIAGKLPINLQKLPVDTLSLSGHKFYGPKGIGVLFVRRGSNLMPIMFGGGQEKGLLPGTESLPNIVGLGVAAKHALADLELTKQNLRRLQNILKEKLSAIEGLRPTGPQDDERRLPGHFSFIVPGVEGESIVLQADLRGLCVSSASACHKGIVQPSHVVSALGFTEQEAKGSVRISAGCFNTEADCENACNILSTIITSLSRQATNASLR
ncbi:MAG: cysteine desulfurase [Candidatus Obscuribacterales bacterium]|nr:cysteine desulfurase [Candidatus Obscuribacterales bacterium]